MAAALMLMFCAVRLDIEQKLERDDIPRRRSPRFHHRFFWSRHAANRISPPASHRNGNPFPRRGSHPNKQITSEYENHCKRQTQTEAEPPIIMLFRTRDKGQYLVLLEQFQGNQQNADAHLAVETCQCSTTCAFAS